MTQTPTEPVEGAEFLTRGLAANSTSHIVFIDAVLSRAHDRTSDAWSTPRAVLQPILPDQPFLEGEAPAYVDSVLLLVFRRARVGDALAATDRLPAVAAWRDKMVALYDGLGDRFAPYPENRSGPDGRETQQE